MDIQTPLLVQCVTIPSSTGQKVPEDVMSLRCASIFSIINTTTA